MTGTVLPFAGSAAPSGWLLCYGQAVSRTTYATLFAVVGTTYGTGDGSTTFNVPDLRGRVAAGKDDMGGSAASRLTNAGTGNPGVAGATLGASGGVDRHAVTAAQMPLHGHPTYISTAAQSGAQSNSSGGIMLFNNNLNLKNAHTGEPNATAGNQVGGSGGDEAHPNVQPTMILNSIIKT